MNQPQLCILAEIAQGNKQLKSIATALGKSSSQIYRSIRALYPLLTVRRGVLELQRQVYLNRLLELLSYYPNLAKPFADGGLEILSLLPSPKAVPQIVQEIGIKRSTVYHKLQQALAVNLVSKVNGKYTLNLKIWPQLPEFLEEYQRYQQYLDARVPPTAVIYHKNVQEIVFSLPEEFDAAPTAFSVYGQYGIELLTHTHYYSLPKKKLSLQKIFLHSLYVAEKDKNIRTLTYIALCYAKYWKKLTSIKHPILDLIKRILKGEEIKDYPSLTELRKKGEMYDIHI